jgi:hypothetical protein
MERTKSTESNHIASLFHAKNGTKLHHSNSASQNPIHHLTSPTAHLTSPPGWGVVGDQQLMEGRTF